MKDKNRISDIKERFEACAIYEITAKTVNSVKKHPKILSCIVLTIFIVGSTTFTLVHDAIGTSEVSDTSVKSNIDNEQTLDGKININTASADELCKIPNVSKNTAKNIVSYRSKVGIFKCIEDIQDVILAEEFEKIMKYLTVD